MDKCVHVLYQSSNEVNKTLEKRFHSYLKLFINDLEKCDVDLIDVEKSTEWVKLNALYIFHVKLFKVNDKKLFKILKDVNRKVKYIYFKLLLLTNCLFKHLFFRFLVLHW